MLRYAAGRIVLTVPVLFGVSLMSFAIIHLIPGDIVSVLAGPTVALDSEAAQNIRRALHLDRPLPVQYGLWLIGALQGDFGNSLVMGLPVGPQIASHLPVTLVLTALSLIFAIMIGLPAGVAAATARGRWPDLAIRGVALLGLSTPPFFVGVAAVLLLSIYLPSFKTLGAVDLHHDPLADCRPCCCRPSSFRWLPPPRSCATPASPCSRCWRSLMATARQRAQVVSAC